MFIPRGNAVHENLATSFVLVDALVEDLCEGGFSGIIEVVLRNADSHIIIDRGAVVAVVEQHESGADSKRPQFGSTTVADIAARSRGERGRVSIYGFPPGAPAALAGLVDAEPLYAALSTDFADLEKMVAKLRRETDRQWFIEVATQNGRLALIHIEDDRCRVLRSDVGVHDGMEGDAESLKELLDECNRVGGAFDVYFKRPGSAPKPAEPAVTKEVVESQPPPVISPPAVVESPAPSHQAQIAQEQESTAAIPAELESETLETQAVTPLEAAEKDSFIIEPNPSDDPESDDLEDDRDKYWASTSPEPLLSVAAWASSSGVDSPAPAPVVPDVAEILAESLPVEPVEEEAGPAEIEVEPAEIVAVDEAESMAEIKRLMGEIAKTIDDAARAVEQRDAFSMYLRAGQLKIADRYPFLDPFGAEFEYMSGEIAFIGKAAPSEFKDGLTESLRLAAVGVIQSSAQPARLRAHMTENLRKLLDRLKPELERFGLDESVEQIMNFK